MTKSTVPPLISIRSHRFRIAVLLMLALFHSVAMRVNLNMAIVATVDVRYFREYWEQTPRSEIRADHEAKIVDSIVVGGYNGKLLWVPPMQAVLFSATFWGSILTVTFTGKVIRQIGAKMALGGAIAMGITVSLATPFLSNHSFPALFLARMAMGAGESFVMPSIGAIASRWIPPSERFPMMEMITSGNQLAASFSAVVTAALCMSPLCWPSVYYFYGVIASLWLLAWLFLAANSPAESSIISEGEEKFLAATIPAKTSPSRIPWRSIVSSPPFIACICCQFAFVYTGTIMQSSSLICVPVVESISNTPFQGFLPTFIRAELRLPLYMNGVFALIPFGTMLIMKTAFSLIARRLNESRFSTPTKRSKIFQLMSSLGCVCTLVAVAFFAAREHLWFPATALVVFGCSMAASVAGFGVSTQSLSPQQSEAISQISATVGVLAGITAPMVMCLIMTLKVNGIVDSIWKTAFSVACTLNIAAGVSFLIFGEVGDQGWKCKEAEPSRSRIYSIERIENGK